MDSIKRVRGERSEECRQRFAAFKTALGERRSSGLPIDGHVWRPESGWRREERRASMVRYAPERHGGSTEERHVREGGELRAFGPGELRAEAGAPGEPSKIVGYAALFNSLSQDLGGFFETIAPGAFSECLAGGDDILGRYNHLVLLGRRSSGTLTVKEDARGLFYSIGIPDTTFGADLVEMVLRGDVTGSSFCFAVNGPDGEAWSQKNGVTVRELRNVTISDVGPVDLPAYLGTNGKVGLRTLPAASLARMADAILPAPFAAAAARRIRLAEAEAGISSTPNLDVAERKLLLAEAEYI